MHLDQIIYFTTKEICAYLEKEYGVAYTPKGMTSLLDTLRFTNKNPKHFPGNAIRQAQEELIEKYNKLKEDKAPEDRIYFMDGVHPLHNSHPP